MGGEIIFKFILPMTIVLVLLRLLGLETKINNIKLKKIIRIISSITPAVPFFCLVFLFITNNDNYRYVATYSSSDLPIRYRISAVWAAREGPLLLWAACCAIVSLIYEIVPKKFDQKLSLKILDCFVLCLLLVAFSLNPFRTVPENSLVISAGLNPLLQTNLMIIHPPLIFAFYTSCVWIGCITVSKIIINDIDWKHKEFLEEINKPTLISFFLGTLGIGLGGLWAYVVLDWGGYWAWDPVETASLLPWIAVMTLLHLKLKKNKLSKEWFMLAGISPVWFSILATVVTRAGGVWAGSVHSFVVNSDTLVDTNLWDRLIILKADEIAGIEIMTYLFILVGLFGIYSGTLLNQKILELGNNQDKNNGNIFLIIFSSVLAGPILVFLGVFNKNMWEVIPIGFPLFVCGISPMIVPVVTNKRIIAEQFKLNLMEGDSLMRIIMFVGMIALSLWIGDIILGSFIVISVLFSVSYKNLDEGWPWIIGTIFLLLFGSWSNLIKITEAAIGILILSIPWAMLSSDDGKKLTLNSVVFWTPIIVSTVYLLLTWVILLSSIDGPRFEAHELFGAPVLFLILCGLSVLGLQGKIERSRLIALVIFVSVASIIFAWFLGDKLPSDSANSLGGPIIRGHVVWLLAPISLIALPALISIIHSTVKKITDSNRNKIVVSVSAHVIHLGVVILIIGHLFATTLIDRNDLSHQITLIRDDTSSYGSYDYTFEDVITLKKDDLEFKNRFDVGDGYIGTKIRINNSAGDSVIVEPGVLRFDLPFETFPRSEVDRVAKLHGDIVVIFDLSQSQAMDNMKNQELDDLQQIRVTIYELPGSHLVWLGWVIMLLGSLTIIFTPPRRLTRLTHKGV
tara:strand:+ start:9271 stop:11826 length:2556 start_codon:yes stop_codon:yes gene_type:complete